MMCEFYLKDMKRAKKYTRGNGRKGWREGREEKHKVPPES